MLQEYHTDMLIIGTGAAGLSGAVYAAETGADVLMLDKGLTGRSGSTVGAVQIAGAGKWSDPRDSYQAFQDDLLKSGRGLNETTKTSLLAAEMETILDDLDRWGMNWDRQKNGELLLTPASGHDYPRTLSAKQGKSGLAVSQTLLRQLKNHPQVQSWSDIITLDLITDQDRVCGALGFDLRRNAFVLIHCRAVLLATGGGGQLFSVTSNPVYATGDGFSLALDAGAELVDMEQIQFYPTGLTHPPSLNGFCMSFYHLGKLLNAKGERFMQQYEPENMENVVRDRLARAIALEIEAGRTSSSGGVWLDGRARSADIQAWFPHEYELCKSRGLDLSQEQAEVAPSAHFIMGGIKTDTDGESRVQGLFAAGESAGGLHGGNRLGNTSLSECLVFGSRASRKASRQSYAPLVTQARKKARNLHSRWEHCMTAQSGRHKPSTVKHDLQQLMQKNVNVLRSKESLQDTLNQLKTLKNRWHESFLTDPKKGLSREMLDFFEVRHMIASAQVITGSALRRQESRGAHNRVDYPKTASEAQHILAAQYNDEVDYRKE